MTRIPRTVWIWPEPRVRAACLGLFSVLGGNAEVIAETLRKALRDKDSLVRARAILLLGRLGAKVNGSLSALIKGLKDKHILVRRAAAAGLMAFRPPAESAIPALQEAFKEQDDLLRSYVISAILVTSPTEKRFLTMYMEGVRDKRFPQTQIAAADAIGCLDPAAESAVPLLTKLLKPSKPAMPEISSSLRYTILQAFRNIGPRAKHAVPALIEILKEEPASYLILETTMQTLKAIGKDAKEALPALKKLLKYKNAGIRSGVEDALLKIEDYH